MRRLCLALVTLLALASPELPAQQAVLVYEDGHMEALAGGQLAEAGQRQGLDHVWLWSDLSAPRRVAAEDFGVVPPPEDRERLVVRVSARDQRLEPGFRVLAAPVEMWTAVHEHLLPVWPVPERGGLRIPIDPTRPWRLRLLGAGKGSWWLDIPAGGKVATLVPVPAPDHTVAIVDADRRAVAEAFLSVLSSSPERVGVMAQYRAGDHGRIHLESLPDSNSLTWIAGGPRHAPVALKALPSALPDELRLGPGGTVRGRFVDPERVPVSGVKIRADAWISDLVTAVATRQAESAEDGFWMLSTLPPGKVGLAAVASGFAPYRTQLQVGGEIVDLGTIRLEPGVTLAVVVEDERNEAVPGVLLEAGPGRSAVTDHSGRARLEGATGSEAITIAARAGGYLPATKTFVPPFSEELRITLRRAFRVEGRFVDRDSIPVQGGTVKVEVGHSYNQRELQPGGRFELDLQPETAVRLTFRDAATRDLTVAVEPGLGGELRDLGDLRAPAGIVVRGRLLRAADATPVATARVWCPRPSEQGDVVAWVHGDLVEARSGEDGSFELLGLAPRPALLRIDALNLARVYVPVAAAPETGQVDLGEVLMDEGATVRVLAGESEDGAVARVDLRNDWLELDMLSAPIVDGGATISHVPTGAATVTVVAGRKLVCEETIQVSADQEGLDVDCRQPGMRVSGTVTVGGKPAGPGLLSWLPRNAVAAPGIIMNHDTPLGISQQQTFGGGRPAVDVEVDAGGFFRTEDLRAGAWEVAWLPLAGSTTSPEPVELPAAEEYELTVAFGGLTLSGLVLDDQEMPVAGARVRDLADSALAFSGPDGSFSLVGLAPGRHQLHASFKARSSLVVESVLEPDREPDPVVLVLKESSEDKIEILVLEEDGEPALGAFVFFESAGGDGRILTTDSEGRASAVLAPPYPEQVRVAGVSAGRWALGPWLSRERAAEGVTLAAQPTGSIRIVTKARRGSPVILSAQGWDLSWLLTRMGLRPIVSPELPLEIYGLPEGSYSIAMDDFSVTISVSEGDRTEVEVP